MKTEFKKKLLELLENAFRRGESRGYENGKNGNTAMYEFIDFRFDFDNEIYELCEHLNAFTDLQIKDEDINSTRTTKNNNRAPQSIEHGVVEFLVDNTEMLKESALKEKTSDRFVIATYMLPHVICKATYDKRHDKFTKIYYEAFFRNNKTPAASGQIILGNFCDRTIEEIVNANR